MGAVTWKNITPVDTSGYIDSMTRSIESARKGIQGGADAMTQYADDKIKTSTDAFNMALIQAEDDYARQALLETADVGNLDMALVQKAYTDANADANELANWKYQNDIKFEQDKTLARIRTKKGNKSKLSILDSRKKIKSAEGEEAVTAPWLTGLLGIADTPREEVEDKLADYFAKYLPDDGEAHDKFRYELFNHGVRFNRTGIDEFHLLNGTSIEDATDAELETFFKTRPKLKSYFEKKKTDTK
jgi:hypothetical protein